MRPLLLQIDAFTDVPFRGNPAAVCVMDDEPPKEWMQAVAAEMNLADTAFVTPRGGATFGLKWFTPTTEVPLCGHATLAAAHGLWQVGFAANAPIAFETVAGTLFAHRVADTISIDLPARTVVPAALPDAVARAVDVPGLWTGRTTESDASKFEYLIVTTEESLRRAELDLAALRRVPAGVILTARSETSDVHFVSRYFAPYYGVDEDPVTGSAHCALATYWAPTLGRTEFRARQLSARGGTLGVRLVDARVHLAGGAVTVLRGELTL